MHVLECVERQQAQRPLPDAGEGDVAELLEEHSEQSGESVCDRQPDGADGHEECRRAFARRRQRVHGRFVNERRRHSEYFRRGERGKCRNHPQFRARISLRPKIFGNPLDRAPSAAPRLDPGRIVDARLGRHLHSYADCPPRDAMLKGVETVKIYAGETEFQWKEPSRRGRAPPHEWECEIILTVFASVALACE